MNSGSIFYLSPECQGGLFEPVESYSTAQADLWALGVILVNLVCGRNPWRQALATDVGFRAYLDDPGTLATILPLSHASSAILAGLFAPNPCDRISLAQLRAQVIAAPAFSTSSPTLGSQSYPSSTTRCSEPKVSMHFVGDYAEWTTPEDSAAAPAIVPHYYQQQHCNRNHHQVVAFGAVIHHHCHSGALGHQHILRPNTDEIDNWSQLAHCGGASSQGPQWDSRLWFTL